MAQYIEAPGFSYDPLPMEQYVQFAKEQALAYEGSLNSAYEFLDKLPILDGGLRTEGWAQELRQEYGSQVQKAIDNFVDTKDRRALARELSAISTRLKTDNDLLVNNYDARAAAPTMQLFQTQPNGANSFTRSGTMSPVNRYQDPATGEIVEENNFIQFQRGQTSLQDAERSYNDYVGAYDIINDTTFMTTNLFNEIEEAIGSKITQDPNQPGVLMVQTDKGLKKFNNTLELVQDPDAMGEYYQASQEAINQLRVQWDQNQSNTVRAYKYRGASFQDYVNDAFATTMPKLHQFGRSTGVTARNAPKGGSPSVTPEKLAEIIVEGVDTDARETAEVDINRYLDASDIKKYNLLVKKARENGYTVNDLLSGNFPESEQFIDLAEKLVTKQMMDAQLNDPVNQEAIRQANIDFDALGQATNFGLRNFAANNPGVNGDIPEEMFKWYTSIGANLGLYGQDELLGMELEDYDFTRVTDWADQFLDPFVDGGRFDRTASPVALQTEDLRNGLKNFGPDLDGTIPMVTPESYEAILAAKANGVEDVTGVAEFVRQEFANMQNPAISWFRDENVAVVRENLTYDQAVEKGLVPETIQSVFETQGDEIRYRAGDFGDIESLNSFIQERNKANGVKSGILTEANKFEVYTPKVRVSPSAEIRPTVDDKLKETVIARISKGADIGNDYQIFVVDRDEENSVTYGPRSLTGSGYNYMTDITALSEAGGLSKVFFGSGSDQKDARYYVEGAVAGVGAGQKSGLLLDVNLRDTDGLEEGGLGNYFEPGKSTKLLIVPKTNAAKEDTFGWIDDYRSKLTTSYAPSYSQTGLFGTGLQSGDQMRQLMELGNKLNVFNLLMPLNSQAAMKKEGVPITNTYLNPQQDQQMGFAVVFDPYRPVGNTTPGRQGVQLSEVYAAKHEDGEGAAWTWQEYFSNRTDESPIMLEEALLAANSQQLSEDYSPEELVELSTLINESAYTNQNGYKVIKLGDFKDLFKRAGVDFNLNKGILFHNKFDLATFTSMINPEAALAE